jgi:hypothetical protein
MTGRHAAAWGALIAVASFAAGRLWPRPSVVQEARQEAHGERRAESSTDSARASQAQAQSESVGLGTVLREETRPDGTRIVTRRVVQTRTVTVAQKVEVARDVVRVVTVDKWHAAKWSKSETIQAPAQRWAVGAMGGLDDSLSPVVGGYAVRRVLGPLDLGGWVTARPDGRDVRGGIVVGVRW